MKIKRTRKEYGGGSGGEVFESDLFRVVFWRLSKGTRTTITIRGIYYDLDFDGKHQFTTDELCMEQLTIGEIKKLINYYKEESFEAGKQYKIKELKKCLEIPPDY